MLDDLAARDGRPAPVHLVGIGGIGVSGIARLFMGAGHEVSGSDLSPSPITAELERLGVPVRYGHAAQNVPAGASLVICSAAIAPGHPEIDEARRRGLPVLKYAQVLGLLMDERSGIAISGTHGKTTTTAMVAHVLIEAGLDPTMVVGGNIPLLGGTSRFGRGRFMVAEACEYDRSFLNLSPTYAVVTNIEADHLDYYRDLDEIRGAFRAFAERVRPGGRIFVCAEDEGAVGAVSSCGSPVETYGIDAARCTWRARSVDLAGGRPRYRLEREGSDLGEVSLSVPGRHNVLNSLAALAAASACGVPPDVAARALASFPGVNRRFQVISDERGVAVVDDYAHHPTELATVIRAARERYQGARVIAVFQPHQYSRTRHLLGEFADVLARADRAVIPEIYAARDSEEDRRAVSADDLVREIRARGGEAIHIPGFDGIFDHLRGIAREGDVILTLGAGDIYRLAYSLRGALGSGKARAA